MMLMNVYAREPLTDSGWHWQLAELAVSPEVAAEKINFHNECPAIWQRSGGLVARP